MNRWTALLIALLIATLASAADVAYEAYTGIAKTRERFGYRIEKRDDPNSHYERVMAWQIIRTVFFGSALWWSFGVWRIHEGNLKREQELDWEK